MAVEKIKAQWESLPEEDKKLIRFYKQMDLDQLRQRMENYGDMVLGATNETKRKEYKHQVTLYTIAFLLKEHNINVKGGGKKTRRSKKRKGTRRRRV